MNRFEERWAARSGGQQDYSYKQSWTEIKKLAKDVIIPVAVIAAFFCLASLIGHVIGG